MLRCEVFMTQNVVEVNVVKTAQLAPVLSSGEVERLLAETLQRELRGWSNQHMLVRVRGVLMNLTAQRRAAAMRQYSKLFSVQLEAEGTLTLNAPLKVLEPYEDGDVVEVVGYPVVNIYQGVVSVRLEVIQAHNPYAQEQPERRATHAQLAQLRSLKPRRNAFPLRPVVSVDVIHSASSTAQVDEDFYQGLGEQISRCRLNAYPVRITSAEDICAAIKASRADILVVIRGGGPDADFSVFNDKAVLEAFAQKKSYRVTGIGHSGHSTLMDLMADFAATVPAEAGAHIQSQLNHMAGLVEQYENSLEQSEYEISQLQQQIDTLANQAEITKQHLQENLKQIQPKSSFKNPWPYILIVILLVLLFLK